MYFFSSFCCHYRTQYSKKSERLMKHKSRAVGRAPGAQLAPEAEKARQRQRSVWTLLVWSSDRCSPESSVVVWMEQLVRRNLMLVMHCEHRTNPPPFTAGHDYKWCLQMQHPLALNGVWWKHTLWVLSCLFGWHLFLKQMCHMWHWFPHSLP